MCSDAHSITSRDYFILSVLYIFLIETVLVFRGLSLLMSLTVYDLFYDLMFSLTSPVLVKYLQTILKATLQLSWPTAKNILKPECYSCIWVIVICE